MKKLWIVLTVMGLLFGLSTAGAADAGLLTAGDVVLRIAVSCGLILIAFLGYRIEVLNRKLYRMRRALEVRSAEAQEEGSLYA